MSKSERLTAADEVKVSVAKLEAYILRHRYRGYDPYDCLSSPAFRMPLLRSNKLLRWGSQQIMKRLPINIRSALGIRQGYNPVTLGLCLHSFSNMLAVLPEQKALYEEEIGFCVAELERLQSVGYSGSCWGYDFDWEAKYGRFPAYTPTIVATGFITNALYHCYIRTGNILSRDLCLSASDFLTRDLHRDFQGETFCFSYSPADRNSVLNATMKGARLLAQVYSITRDARLVEEAKRTIRFVARHQKESGAWPYSVGDARTWVDNFHTGYILDCLDEYIKLTSETEFDSVLRKGVEFYRNNFFVNGEIPKYYDCALYPIDATAGAQSILTLVRLGYMKEATRVALWMISNMQDARGFYYYQKHALYINRIPYMRWSNAWMYLALSSLLRRLHDLD